MGKSTGKCDGFTLLELMVAIGILLVVAGGAFSFLMSYQNYYQSTALRADMHSSLRGATELMQQDIGQAGLLSLGANCSAAIPNTSTSGCPTLSTAVTAGSHTPTMSSTTGMYVGETLAVDVGSAQENVVTTAVTSTNFTATFSNSHAIGTVVSASGVIPQGILCNACSTTPVSPSSTATDMYLTGDINGDGSMVVVHYNCNTGTGFLTRSVTALSASSQSLLTLLDNITANPGGTACFQYASSIVSVGGTPYTFVTAVSVTLTVKTSEIDPVTKVQTTETKSFMNLAPRNIYAGYTLAINNVSGSFQPTPSSCVLAITC